MTKIIKPFTFILIVLPLSFSTFSSEDFREIQWGDLVPPAEAIDDPFTKLSGEQLSELGELLRVRALVNMEKASPADETKLLKSLQTQGLDVDFLLAERERIIKARKAQAEALDPALNQQNIRMPGFLIPLEFSGKKTTEFLLVPYVGACIHTPPPPANQIVQVEFDKGYKLGSLYQAVWISGRMQVGLSTSNLFLVDGATDVSVGYQLIAEDITAYKDDS